jgi:amidophosphoribosyltransferase
MCGFIGIFGHRDVAREIYTGLMTIQHRGQDSAGMITFSNRFNIKKGKGLVRDVFKKKNFIYLKGNIGIGHVRYPTIGKGTREEAQPFLSNVPYGIALAHNGNVVNFYSLSEKLEKERYRTLNSQSDGELILNVLADELLQSTPFSKSAVFDAMESLFDKVKGSYSGVAIIKEKGLIAFRDSHGIKPIIYGRKGDSVAVASESVALETLGYKVERDILPGEVLFVDNNRNIHRRRLRKEKQFACIFEYVYFARPDSIIDGIPVYQARLNLGKELSKKIKGLSSEIDFVVPVPDTSRTAALSLAENLGLKYREGLIKNRYIGRTFIMGYQKKRETSIRLKLSPIKHELKGKRILLVDDSIVRGNTSKQIVRLVRESGAKKIHFAVTSPPLRNPCYYGIDMQTKKEFIASDSEIEKVRKAIGADSLIYQSLEGMKRALSTKKDLYFCTACFDGRYPVPIEEEERKRIETDRGT